jgi:hypothetical protein
LAGRERETSLAERGNSTGLPPCRACHASCLQTVTCAERTLGDRPSVGLKAPPVAAVICGICVEKADAGPNQPWTFVPASICAAASSGRLESKGWCWYRSRDAVPRKWACRTGSAGGFRATGRERGVPPGVEKQFGGVAGLRFECEGSGRPVVARGPGQHPGGRFRRTPLFFRSLQWFLTRSWYI